MGCNECDHKPQDHSYLFPCAAVEINNPEKLVLLRKVVIPATMTEEDVPPAIGRYHNVVLKYESSGHIYLYSSDGIPTLLETELPQEIIDRIANLEDGLEETNQELEDLKNSPDVVDIVPTYAELQSYDTSELGDNDIIRVLQDETHGGASAYYRWNKGTSTWTFIGVVGSYYTKDETDTLLNNKQDVLTAGDNIQITGNTISATDTTYAAGNGLILNGTEFSVDTTVIAEKDNIPTVVQSKGTSTASVMSQAATTKMIHPSYQYHPDRIGIGESASVSGNGSVAIGDVARADQTHSIALGSAARTLLSYGIAIGGGSGNTFTIARGGGSIAIGVDAEAGTGSAGENATGAVALGAYSYTTQAGEVSINSANTNYGYNGSNYRLLTGLYDPQSAHDAATKGYVDPSTDTTAPTSSTTGRLGEIRIDTSTNTAYMCVSADSATSTYTWKQITA